MEKHYNFSQTEKNMQKFWEDERIYRFDREAKGEIYSIDTPPPTVSGSLHIGHLFSYTQAEIIARYRRMQGYNVLYPFGFDDNGLPTERLVEREHGIKARDVPRSELFSRCETVTSRYEDKFRDFFSSLGFSADWELGYRTISPEVVRISQELFLELCLTGRAYTKESPVLWCTECGTSIAQAELDTCDTETDFIYLPFMSEGTVLPVATTRPELLFGCVCLFVHPEDERYTAYIGKNAHVPLYDLNIPILADEKVSMGKGTGAVMCATFGDSTDAEWFLSHSLPYRRVISPDGRLAEDVPHIGGMMIRAARKEIIRLLGERGLILKSERLTHTVSVHERCGSETEIIPSRQWYIDVLTERKRFLEAGERINWYPTHMKARYTAWVGNLKWDWCISRQRRFGVPFPVWYCADCGRPAFASKEMLPVDPSESPYDGVCPCGSSLFVPESAVMDTWATSSITPQINERTGQKLTPMSMRTHAHEIIRTWTFYTIVRSLYHTGDIPWRDLMICGFVLAKKGEKLSKSKGGGLDPEALIATHSADALRYWTAGARLGSDTFFSPDELSEAKRFMTKLWNAARFAFSHLADFKPESGTQLLPVDRWIVERVNETSATAAGLLDEYEIGSARHGIDELFWRDLCDYYLEIVKERLYRPDLHGEKERRSAQSALYYAFLNILRFYSIYVPHITEYLYQEYFRKHEETLSIHRTLWVKPGETDSGILQFGEQLKETIAGVRRYKSERGLSMRAELEVLEISADKGMMEWFRLSERDIMACANAREVRYI